MLAPHINQSDKVVLFDGVCKLCSAWARFLIRFDKRRMLKLATMQSPEGQAILSFYGRPLEQYDSLLLIHGERLYSRSTAVLKVLTSLPFPWPALAVFYVIPKCVRDWLYDRVALNRYSLFGQYERCLLPSSEHEARFLSAANAPHPTEFKSPTKK